MGVFTSFNQPLEKQFATSVTFLLAVLTEDLRGAEKTVCVCLSNAFQDGQQLLLPCEHAWGSPSM